MKTSSENPVKRFIEKQGVLVLDGGLATRLEGLGSDLDNDLWSARVLLEEPDRIRRVHLEFLEAGADCITTSSYQASVPGFEKLGLSRAAAFDLFSKSVRLAEEARELFWSQDSNRSARLRPLVAASVGPYGAYLADGSEYVGGYGIDDDGLYAFHRDRWHVLAGSRADLLACETIPSEREARVLLRLLDETPDIWTWMSFSCRDGTRLGDGSRLRDIAALCAAAPRVAAIGVNCTPPEYISELIGEARNEWEKPIIVYPNSGGRYSGADRVWSSPDLGLDWGRLSVEWAEMGADLIGGCCRVGCREIAEIRDSLVRSNREGAEGAI